MPSYSIDGVIPVVDPSAYVHPSAVLIGDVIVGPRCYVGPCASLRGDFGRIVLEEGSNVQDHCCIHGFPDHDTVVEVNGHIGHGAILHSCIVRRDALVGMNAVVIGQSNIVGRPMALELLMARCTVTICHSATRDLPGTVQGADIVVAGVGKAKFVQRDWVKPGAIVIDVGMNRDDAGKLCGDVDFAAVREVAAWITPVPGGVGPMTRAMLLVNTLEAAESAAA